MKNEDIAFNSLALVLTFLFSLMIVWPAIAEEAPAADNEAALSADALADALARLDAELRILEEDLLYPASSRVAVYFSLDVGEFFALDAVTLTLNGKDVAHHLYTDRERRALADGGVQQLFVGNARQGANELVAVFHGIGPHERPYKRATSVEFEHGFEPVFVELTVRDVAGQQAPEFLASVSR